MFYRIFYFILFGWIAISTIFLVCFLLLSTKPPIFERNYNDPSPSSIALFLFVFFGALLGLSLLASGGYQLPLTLLLKSFGTEIDNGSDSINNNPVGTFGMISTFVILFFLGRFRWLAEKNIELRKSQADMQKILEEQEIKLKIWKMK